MDFKVELVVVPVVDGEVKGEVKLEVEVVMEPVEPAELVMTSTAAIASIYLALERVVDVANR